MRSISGVSEVPKIASPIAPVKVHGASTLHHAERASVPSIMSIALPMP